MLRFRELKVEILRRNKESNEFEKSIEIFVGTAYLSEKKDLKKAIYVVLKRKNLRCQISLKV
ncbi:hypothetical protein ABE07_11215 [Bacillus thuringiensis]|nr:Hypothetical protein NF53_p5206 [Bacillus thuringiensis serovar indiana]MBG9643304.1 hypothetical protein [Bacillus thuringiensis]MBG9649396.1 hypothetical protein [Bacillus thuringiensis]